MPRKKWTKSQKLRRVCCFVSFHSADERHFETGLPRRTFLAAVAGQGEVDAGDAVVVEDLEVGHGGVGDAGSVGRRHRPGHQHRGRRRHGTSPLDLPLFGPLQYLH